MGKLQKKGALGMRPAAILWDYDGTLVDSAVKNRAVTIELLRRFDADIEQHLPPALQSLDAYRRAQLRWPDWRQLWGQGFGLDAAQVAQVGQLWAAAQQADPLQPPLFCGLRQVLPQLAAQAPMGICSRNSREHIAQTLHRYGVAPCFGAIVGWQQLPPSQQKPHPAGFLACLRQLGVEKGPVVSIGDSPLDVQFAHAAAEGLAAAGRSVQVVCVAARFGDGACYAASREADACAAAPEDLPALLRAL